MAILRHKGDRISMLQAATLEKGRNEAWVFATYVTSVPEEAKDETFYVEPKKENDAPPSA